MIKDKRVAFVIFVVAFVAIWNLCEILYATFITKSAYQFKPLYDLGGPLLAANILGFILFLRNNDK